MDEAGRDHLGSPNPTPCSCRFPSSTELRAVPADYRLGTGTDTTCTALEVAVKGVRDR